MTIPSEGTTGGWSRVSTPASTIGPWLPEGALGASLAEGLARVETALVEAVGSEHAFIREAAGHLMSAGGKRFRPMLALLAAQLSGAQAPAVTRATVVCERTHLATLYHDDVMDEAALRRGAPSANSRWTNSIAILTGDLLFARASDLLADLGPEAVRIQAQTFERLVTGQIRETVGPQPGDDPVAHYLEVLADKTGSLVATTARFAARFAGGHAAGPLRPRRRRPGRGAAASAGRSAGHRRRRSRRGARAPAVVQVDDPGH